MNFDTYWKDLIHRVYHQNQTLTGPEALLYRLTCIYGETMVDGLEAYFERRYPSFDDDMQALSDQGFSGIADLYQQARQAMFGDAALTEETVVPVIDRLLDDEQNEEDAAIIIKLDEISARLIPRLPDVLNVRDRIGIENGLFDYNP